jgi:ABC-type phosphate/phosphonate transport system ATPase subunit
MFQVFISDESGDLHEVGSVKIGFSGQDTSSATYESLDWPRNELPENYFSLGLSVEYYKKIRENLSAELREAYCLAMRDVVSDLDLLNKFGDEQVFRTSLLREGSISSVKGQYRRVLDGGMVLTDFNFRYKVEQTDNFAGYELDFKVIPASTPPTNIHAMIGRNGVGKTTFLNDLVRASLTLPEVRGKMLRDVWFRYEEIEPDYFSSVVSVSFSAFDPFNPPEDQPEPDEGPAYHYIGIKNPSDPLGNTLKSPSELKSELVSSIQYVLSEEGKAERWRDCIETLESDDNFKEINLTRFVDNRDDANEWRLNQLAEKLSSGHAIVLLTITKLVAYVQEKTLVLIDEPESHLHPPLLSAFMRSLSGLLYNRNGVAIIATHSPVVLQEIPKDCAWKIVRSRNRIKAVRPQIETFAENVGTLTHEVFGLEVGKSGFHRILASEVESGKEFEQIISEYSGEIGFEGQALIRSLISQRGSE